MRVKSKILSVLLACAMLLSLLPTTAFAVETVDPETCTHDWEQKSTLKAGNCKTGATGIGKFTCKVCGKSEYQSIAATHTKPETGVTTVSPTCGEAGSEAYECTVCKEQVSTTLPATGRHTWNEDGFVDATCTSNAKVGKVCDVCGATDGELKEIPGTKLDHIMVLDKTNPAYKAVTCEEDGLDTMKCNQPGCTHTTSTVVTAPGHNWVDDEAVGNSGFVAAGCENADGMAQVCTRCGDTRIEEIGGESGGEPAKGHDWEHHAAVTADCETNAMPEYWQCKNCGKYKLTANGDPTDTAPEQGAKGEHTFASTDQGTKDEVVEATCQVGESYKLYKTCTVCEQEILVQTVVGDADGADETKHVKQLVSTLKPATCTTAGIAKYKCSVCQKDLGYDTLTGEHNYTDSVTKPASCTEDGEKTRTCSVCPAGTEGHTITETIEASGHDFDDEIEANVTVNKPATCGEAGSMTVKCSRCEETETVSIDATGEHEWAEDVDFIPATCTEGGKIGIACTICGTLNLDEDWDENSSDPALGHDMQASTDADDGYVAATCEEGGTDVKVCSRCDKVETSDSEALGHDLDEEFVAADCEHADGVKVTCSRCDYEDFEEMPEGLGEGKKSHTWVKHEAVDATCEAGGMPEYWQCSVCEQYKLSENGEATTTAPTATAKLSHNYGTNPEIRKNVTEATCQDAGSYDSYKLCTLCEEEILLKAGVEIPVDEENPAHVKELVKELKAGSCVDNTSGIGKYTCSVCGKDLGYEVIPASESHDYPENPTSTTPATCLVDGKKVYVCANGCGVDKEVVLEATGHNYPTTPDSTKSQAATCGKDGKNVFVCTNNCGVDKEEKVDASGNHTWLNDQTIDATCTEPAKVGKKCSVCQAVGEATVVTGSTPLGHNMVLDTSDSEYVPATCTTGGVDVKNCSRNCGVAKEKTNTDALGHTWGPETLVEASCTSAAGIKHTCTVTTCGFSEIVPFTGALADPQKPHTPEDVAAVAATCTKKGSTAGKKCATCGTVIEGCTEVPMIAHTPAAAVRENVVNPSVDGDGNVTAGSYDEVVYCSVCETEISRTAKTITHGENNHSYTVLEKELKPATCTESGIAKYSCSACDAATYQTIEAGHVWNAGFVTKSATCGEDGVKIYTCIREDENGDPACTDHGEDEVAATRTVTIPATGQHNPVTKTTEATCTSAAMTGTSCSVCGYSEDGMTVVPGSTALGHQWVDDTASSANQAATCTAGGKKAQKCNRTGCTETRTVNTDALGHELDEPEYVAPTCTENGKSLVYCTRENCPNKKPTTGVGTPVETEDLGKFGDTATNHVGTTTQKAKIPATCTEVGHEAGTYCTACNTYTVGGAEIAIDPEAHDWDEGEVATEPDCENGTAGVKTYTCQNDSTHTKTEDIEPAHTWGTPVVTPGNEATCTQEGRGTVVCSKCGEENTAYVIEALGHEYADEPDEVEESTCTVKGSKTWYCTNENCDEADEDGNGKAKVEELELADHEYEEVLVEASCTENAKVKMICKNCDQPDPDADDLFEIPNSKLSHVWVIDNDNAGNEPAKCGVAGKQYYKCNNEGCEETKFEATDALEHVPGAPETVAPTCTAAGRILTYCTRVGCDNAKPATGIGTPITDVEDTAHPATNHVGTTEHREGTAATCTNPGRSAGDYCTACNQWLSGDETLPIDPDAHVPELVKTLKPATCAAAGIGKYECSECHANLGYLPLEKLAHTWGKDENNESTGVCTECGTTCEHDWDTSMSGYRICDICGKVEEVECEHENTVAIGEAKTATCKEDGLTAGVKCSDCDEVLEAQQTISKETVEHTWGEPDMEIDFDDDGEPIYTSVKTCDVCGKKEQVPATEAQIASYLALFDELMDDEGSDDEALV